MEEEGREALLLGSLPYEEWRKNNLLAPPDPTHTGCGTLPTQSWSQLLASIFFLSFTIAAWVGDGCTVLLKLLLVVRRLNQIGLERAHLALAEVACFWFSVGEVGGWVDWWMNKSVS